MQQVCCLKSLSIDITLYLWPSEFTGVAELELSDSDDVPQRPVFIFRSENVNKND
jgi:hypothetical protein